MTDEVKAPESESKPLDAETPSEPKEETIAEVLKRSEETTKKEEQRLVPEAVLLEYKNQNKELKRDIKELKTLIESGASTREISEDLKDIAKEHDVDENFLKKLAKNIKLEAEKDLEERFSADIKPIKDRERAERMEIIFNEHYNKTLEVMPEFKDIANREVIKQLSLVPSNAKKTFSQILQETYGHLIDGKRTMETARARKGGIIEDIDYKRMQRDQEYYQQVMADPELKAKYNKDLHKRLNL